MKLDKETIIAITVCLVILFAWDPVCNMIWPPKPVKTHPTSEVSDATSAKATDKGNRNASPAGIAEKISEHKNGEKNSTPVSRESLSQEKRKNTPLKIKKSVPDAPQDQTKSQKGIIVNKKTNIAPLFIENDFINAEIDPVYGKISALTLKRYYKSNIKTFKKTSEKITLFSNLKNGALQLSSDREWILDDVKSTLQNNKTELHLTRKFKTSDGHPFSVTQYWKTTENFSIQYKIEINNDSADKLLNLPGLKISDGGLPNIHELANDKIPFRESHEISYYDPDAEKVYSKEAQNKPGFLSKIFGGEQIAKKHENSSELLKVKASWVAVSNKYFATILVPQKFNFDSLLLKSEIFPKKAVEKGISDFTVAEADGLLNLSIKPAQSFNASFKFYAGPKKIEFLHQLHPATTKIMRLYMLGMKFLEPLSRLMLSALLWLQGLCGSYGLSIILLTIIVKSLLWPVTHKANVSMRKMQKINPIIQELRKKYKNDHQRLNVEMMKLYKEHKVNPFGGCLPILLQMPIFFALYSALSGAVEPRHTAFLWIHDLTLPDTVGTIAGLPINPLMLIMTITMIFQQKITPSAADPAQKKMMMFMPLLMLVMLYSLPSGLTLYWTVSQLITIAQLLVNRKFEPKAENAVA